MERLVALAFLITGLSHLLAPCAWVRFFERVAAQGELAGIWNGLLHLPFRLVIAACHPVWEGPGRQGEGQHGDGRVRAFPRLHVAHDVVVAIVEILDVRDDDPSRWRTPRRFERLPAFGTLCGHACPQPLLPAGNLRRSVPLADMALCRAAAEKVRHPVDEPFVIAPAEDEQGGSLLLGFARVLQALELDPQMLTPRPVFHRVSRHIRALDPELTSLLVVQLDPSRSHRRLGEAAGAPGRLEAMVAQDLDGVWPGFARTAPRTPVTTMLSTGGGAAAAGAPAGSAPASNVKRIPAMLMPPRNP